MSGARASSSPQLPRGAKKALALLLEAHELAQDSEDDAWDYAVEIQMLRGAGITNSGLRWLVEKGWAEHRVESPLPTDANRNLQAPPSRLALTEQTCFILSETGTTLARRLLAAPANGVQIERVALLGDAQHGSKLPLPQWDAARRELRALGLIAKRFKRPAPLQWLVLASFEELGWVCRIDDPLSGLPEQKAKERLHGVITRLNKGHQNAVIRFTGDGTGRGICWEYVQPALRKKMSGQGAMRTRSIPDTHQIDRRAK